MRPGVAACLAVRLTAASEIALLILLASPAFRQSQTSNQNQEQSIFDRVVLPLDFTGPCHRGKNSIASKT